jgi:hypothetical protein
MRVVLYKVLNNRSRGSHKLPEKQEKILQRKTKPKTADLDPAGGQASFRCTGPRACTGEQHTQKYSGRRGPKVFTERRGLVLMWCRVYMEGILKAARERKEKPWSLC